MCRVCLVSLPFLAIQISDLLSNIIRGDSSGTMYGSLLKNSWINIMKCAKAIPTVHAALYSISELDRETGSGTCVLW